MDNEQGVLLVLKTSDLIAGTSKDAINANFTWRNIDLTKLLGDMWDKYEYFNLSLVMICPTSLNPAINRPPGYLNVVNVNMTGFPCVCYDTGRKLLNQTIHVSTYTDQSNIGGLVNTLIVQDYNNVVLTFNKSKPIIDINIFYTSSSNETTYRSLFFALVAINRAYYDRVFMFRITGLEKSEDIHLERRIF